MEFCIHANCKSVIAPVLAASDQELSNLRVRILLFITGKKRSALSGDSDDDGEANTYDYNDSFIDDQDLGGKCSENIPTCICSGQHHISLFQLHKQACTSVPLPTPTQTTLTLVDSSSSYGGDSEDSDWAPPDEDVKELVAEATSFISNKKMRKPT